MREFVRVYATSTEHSSTDEKYSDTRRRGSEERSVVMMLLEHRNDEGNEVDECLSTVVE